MRVVCDTNVLVRAAARPNGPARALLDILRDAGHTLIVSPLLLLEVRRVFDYPRVRRDLQIADEAVEEFLASLEAASALVHPALHASILSEIRDPDDEAILQTAVTGMADVLCTLDRHFQTPEVRAYCGTHAIRVLTDVELLRELRPQAPSIPVV